MIRLSSHLRGLRRTQVEPASQLAQLASAGGLASARSPFQKFSHFERPKGALQKLGFPRHCRASCDAARTGLAKLLRDLVQCTCMVTTDN